MITKMMQMTQAEALANITPYNIDDDNTLIKVFIDVDDNDAIKGIFYDSTAPNNIAIRKLSTSGIVYRAQMNQVLTNDPINVTLINDLISGASDPIVWARAGVGVYTGTLVGAFTDAAAGRLIIKVGANSDGIVQAKRTSDDVITISSFTHAGVAADDIIKAGWIEMIRLPQI